MTLYMAVTADKYELPLVVEKQLYLLCGKLGIQMKAAIQEYSRIKAGRDDCSGRYRGYRLRMVEVEDDEETGTAAGM